ncbi:hypothetical protein F5X96DRAFT_151676 [Biscogniauxia mediterranea]|nr:hypothetical protein F5X96DRAFT_151676 [Biscogniauxia mediterranea]
MASLATTLGLRAASLPSATIPNHAPGYLMFHFVFAYALLSSRILKQYYGIDHNASPREDLDKYGEEAVKSGKLTRKQLAMLRRNESAHANAVENYTLFVAAMSFATITGVEREYVNRVGLIYTAARVAYGAAYILIDHPLWSQIRGTTWWTGNISCLWLLWRAWSKLS